MSQPKISGFFKRKEPFETVKIEEEDKGPVSKKLCVMKFYALSVF